MAQAGAELQLLRKPFGAIGQRTVADQHHPVPAVQRKGGAAAHETFQHAHGQAGALQHAGQAAPHQKAGRGPSLEQPRPACVKIHRQQVQRGAGFLLGAL